MAEDMHVACPQCGWQPDAEAYWQCHCSNVWDTFATFGVCPNCKHTHKQTQCPFCHRWSPHTDWYGDLPHIDWQSIQADTRT